MKVEEKKKVVVLRKQGISLGEIAKRVGVSKGSVSNWVRDVKLTARQREQLNKNGHSINVIEKRRNTRITNTQNKRESIIKKARAEVSQLQSDPLWCIGVALYWGEGGKTQQTARVSNSDPAVIRIMMRFFKKYSLVSREKYRAHVHTFSHNNAEKAVHYWSEISGIPTDKFFKTYVKQSSATKRKRQTLPFGTVQVYVHDSDFFFRLMGWMLEVKEFGKR
jgi:transcriptional regulator with XRE-family HTH domain